MRSSILSVCEKDGLLAEMLAFDVGMECFPWRELGIEFLAGLIEFQRQPVHFSFASLSKSVSNESVTSSEE